MIARAFAYTDAIQVLVVIMTALGILDLLLSSVAERRRELALWRVIGADDGSLRRAVMVEALTLGVIGTILGSALGIVTAWMWVAVNYRYFVGYYLELHVSGVALGGYAGLVAAMSIAAGTIAGHYATRQSILTGVRVG